MSVSRNVFKNIERYCSRTKIGYAITHSSNDKPTIPSQKQLKKHVTAWCDANLSPDSEINKRKKLPVYIHDPEWLSGLKVDIPETIGDVGDLIYQDVNDRLSFPTSFNIFRQCDEKYTVVVENDIDRYNWNFSWRVQEVNDILDAIMYIGNNWGSSTSNSLCSRLLRNKLLQKIDGYTFAPVGQNKRISTQDGELVDLRKCSDNDKNIMNILDNSHNMWKEKYDNKR